MEIAPVKPHRALSLSLVFIDATNYNLGKLIRDSIRLIRDEFKSLPKDEICFDTPTLGRDRIVYENGNMYFCAEKDYSVKDLMTVSLQDKRCNHWTKLNLFFNNQLPDSEIDRSLRCNGRASYL
ncbi:MAG: hypothetical protein ACE5FT_06345 [Candidatus Nanoarchaeia archaeon]